MNEEKRKVYREFAFIGGIISFLMLLMVGFYLSITVRMTSAQRLYSLLTAGLVCLGFLIVYIFFILREIKVEMENLERTDAEDKIIKVEKILALPARFSFIAFWFWAIGSIISAIIFYLFFGFSAVQSIEIFFLGMCGGFFAPLIMYYLYKDRMKKFLKNLALKIDYESYQKFLSFSLPLKVTLPFIISILITFILIIAISIRMRDDLIIGVLKSIGEKELSLLKTGEHQPVGGKITIDPNETKGKIEGTIAELSKKGKKIYIDPYTMNIFVFEKIDGGIIESIVYPWKDLVRYPSRWNRAIWILAILALAILVLIPYLTIRDLKSSIDDIKNFLERKERPTPSDDEFNFLFFALLKFADDFDNITRGMSEKVESLEKRFSELTESIKFVEANLALFEDAIGEIKKHTDSEKGDIAVLRGFLNECKNFFGIEDEGVQINAGVKNNKEVSEEIINFIHDSLENGKKIFSSIKELEKFRSHELSQRIDDLREDSPRVRKIKNISDINKMTSENLSRIKEILFPLDLKIKESKEAVKKFVGAIRGVSKSIENVKGDSEKIGEIARVIKEIIEETNLLSLNASIIAAQAGEKGKSFAVVAEEIKELAERTEISTREINQIVSELQRFIENSVNKMTEISNFVEGFVREFDYIDEKSNLIISEIEKMDNSFKGLVKLSNEISSFCSDLDETAKTLAQVFTSTDSYEKYVEYIKTTVSILEKALEFIIRSQNFVEDQISSVRKIKEKGGFYLQKLDGVKNSLGSIDHKISEVVNSLERIVKLINNMKIKIKEVRA
jgi:methyl-accepting chemotaxis protein